MNVVDQIYALLPRNQDGGVEPDETDRAVAGEDLFELGLDLLFEIATEVALLHGLREIPGVAGCVGAMPVLILRVVKAQGHAGFVTGLGELFHRIAGKRSGVDDVVVANGGVVHGEAVVMLGCENKVFRTGVLSELDPRTGVELDRVEPGGELFVVGDGNLVAEHDPFGDAVDVPTIPLAGGNGVETPVDEHAEAGVGPPGEAVAVGPGLGFSAPSVAIAVSGDHAGDSRVTECVS